MIRSATKADLGALCALETACFGPGAWNASALSGELARGFALLDEKLRAYLIGLPIGVECEARVMMLSVLRQASDGALS